MLEPILTVVFEKPDGISDSEYLSETTYETPLISKPPLPLSVPTAPAGAAVASGAGAASSAGASASGSAAVSTTVSCAAGCSAGFSSETVSTEAELPPPIAKVVLLPEHVDDETMIDAVPDAAALNTISPSLPENEASEKYKVKKADAKQLVLTKDNKDYEIGIGESLPSFDGNIRYESGKKLSNFLELSEGMELVRGVFSNSYQEILIEQAINAHFETEISNFFRKGFKVKTITLFFIDNIYSYRMKDGWLKGIFEKRLRAKLDELLKQHTSGEYHDYLLATKNNISGAHGGYFAQDWGQPDSEAIAEELQDILHKERTLTFRKTDGSWNIRRFFFSKWTLKEGWDNPNVFTICKLRSSGSETSKIQEAGRGLRLPVDEQGNRLASGEWKLNFIIGYDEKDFAQKLIGEINQDTKIKLDNLLY